MMQRRRLCLLFAPLCLAACSDQAGVDGSEILQPYGALSGGMVFATQARVIDGVNGYDLFWVPLTQQPTTTPLPLLRLTNADGNEVQPSVSKGGNGLVFAREGDGIYLISTSGRVSRVSDSGGTYRDSLPAISWDGARVAWVREDRSRPLGSTGFYETFIMIASYDGTNARPVNPRPGVIQDAPTFEPSVGATRLAWTEFNASTISFGPSDYGIWVQDLNNGSGVYACKSPAVQIGDRSVPYRCFGEHLTWVVPGGDSVLVATQDLLEVNLRTGELSTIWPQVIVGLQGQNLGSPDIGTNSRGFFPRFPLSASYSNNLDRLVMDGVVYPTDGDSPTLGFYIAGVDGGGVWRVPIEGYVADIDQVNTNDYLFSLATPQLMP